MKVGTEEIVHLTEIGKECNYLIGNPQIKVQ